MGSQEVGEEEVEWLFHALDRVGVTQEGIAEGGERERAEKIYSGSSSYEKKSS